MTATTPVIPMPELQLPWESTSREDRRYRVILRNLLCAVIAFGLLVPFLPVEELSREKQEALPPHLARVVLEKKELPPPPPPKPVERKVEKGTPRMVPETGRWTWPQKRWATWGAALRMSISGS